MWRAYTEGRCRGYNGVSALTQFKELNMVWGIPIDKMHNMDLGVLRKLFHNIWLNSKNSTKPYVYFSLTLGTESLICPVLEQKVLHVNRAQL